ncbi:hypothetical protein [Streptomyces sp. NPDC058335]|uniref:hypothetical protein n=1 Tax=Streptomyces sp. NPDC058335 TaxID=3346451 RepID=UPI0036542461
MVGTGAGAVAGRPPALAVVLAVLAAGTWWFGRRRCSRSPKIAHGDGCRCAASAVPPEISGASGGQGAPS